MPKKVKTEKSSRLTIKDTAQVKILLGINEGKVSTDEAGKLLGKLNNIIKDITKKRR